MKNYFEETALDSALYIHHGKNVSSFQTNQIVISTKYQRKGGREVPQTIHRSV